MGRKCSVASTGADKMAVLNRSQGKKDKKPTGSIGKNQPKISNFFSSKSSTFTAIKEASRDNIDKNEAPTVSSVTKHVKNIKRRLSLGSKKKSKVNMLDIENKIPDTVLEADSSLEIKSEIASNKDDANHNDTLYSNEQPTPLKSLNDEDSTTMKSSLMAKPHATSTPNKGKQFEDVQKSKKNRSTIRKVSPASIVGNTSIYDAFQSFELRKKQKLSTSNEKIILSDTTNECPVTTVTESPKPNLSDTAMSEVNTMGSLSKDAEFEFENSLVTELSFQQQSKALNKKTSLSKTNQMQEIGTIEKPDTTLDHKEIMEVFDDSFSWTSPDAKKISDTKIKKSTEDSLFNDLESQTLSFQYGRHIVESVEIDIIWGFINLKLLRYTSAHKKTLKNIGGPCDTNITPKKYLNVILKGSWAQTTKVEKGDIVNILNTNDGQYNLDQVLVIDDSSNNLIIVNPDRLMTGTSIVSTLFCMRKAVLNEWFKGIEGTNKVMLLGTLLHEVLQKSLQKKVKGLAEINDQLDDSLKSPALIQDMLALSLTPEMVRKEVEPFLSHILFFIEKYVLEKDVSLPTPAYTNNLPDNQKAKRNAPATEIWPGTVQEVRDIEENIWSPRLGIKGKVDLTLHVKLHKKDKQGRISKTLPLELKTGRPSGSAEHRGQVILYSMMMSERWPDPQSGLLLYLRNSSITEIQAGIHEVRGLVQLRNQLEHYVSDGNNTAGLPEPINSKRACEQCSLLNVCTLYQKLGNEVPSAPNHAMHELIPQSTNHLMMEDLEFFASNSSMAQMELKESLKLNGVKKLWCNTPSQREIMGNAISNLQVKRLGDIQYNATDISSVKHTFTRIDLKENSSLPKTTFTTGELVIVSTDHIIALSQGTVYSLDENKIIVILDRDLHNLQLLEGKNNIFHIDRYEYSSGSSFNMVNLAKLMSKENPIAEKLRNIIVNKGKDAKFLSGLPKEVATSSQAKAILRPLNRVQQKAVFRSMMAEQFVLLEGMPGCGKTTVIVALIRLLLTLGKSVLLTSYTHSAVDNVLLKMIEKDELQPALKMPFLRLGKPSRINPQVYSQSADQRLMSKSKPGGVQQSLKHLYENISFVATTCMGANHPVITTKPAPFDYCILDEAGQCLMLSALGPLFHSKKFVLVGDPHQLPPLVQSKAAKRQGMDISLFSYLATNSESVIPLTMQYRMNKKIQSLANHLTYEGRLECGSESVANKMITFAKRAAGNHEPQWITRVFDGSSIENSVLFLNTEHLEDAMETTCDLGVYNPGEGLVVEKICQVFQNCCVNENLTTKPNTKDKSVHKLTIGVIAPYRAQVMHLRNKLQQITSSCTLDINTIDQFQGQDKDVIIYSCTRSTPKKTLMGCELETPDDDTKRKSDIMDDKRRLNVAITRAKCKLIIIGNVRALKSYNPFERLIQFLEQENNVFQIVNQDLDCLN